jgi:hypothetical protein
VSSYTSIFVLSVFIRHHNMMTIQAPSFDDTRDLCISPSLSAMKMICTITLLRMFYIYHIASGTFTRIMHIVSYMDKLEKSISHREAEKEADLLCLTYLSTIANSLGKSYCFPSFATLSKFWQDPSCKCGLSCIGFDT